MVANLYLTCCSDMYPSIVKELQANAGTIEVVSEERLAALIGCVEMSVVAASYRTKKISFQHLYV